VREGKRSTLFVLRVKFLHRGKERSKRVSYISGDDSGRNWRQKRHHPMI